MKQSPELEKAQAMMQAGVLTLGGFLGQDRRSLAEILAADEQTVRRRGVTHAQIADCLSELTSQGADLLEAEILLEGRFKITVRDDRGVMPSPWGDGVFGKGEVDMINTVSGKTWRWTELCLHLIRVHGFYSGQGSPYRLEPDELIDILGIKPLKNS